MEVDFLQGTAEVGVQESSVAATAAMPQGNAWHKEASS